VETCLHFHQLLLLEAVEEETKIMMLSLVLQVVVQEVIILQVQEVQEGQVILPQLVLLKVIQVAQEAVAVFQLVQPTEQVEAVEAQ
tara:strand:+ start:209 stop:466 length:258 start_codon:yes stop_codon:yes gene_type:complete